MYNNMIATKINKGTWEEYIKYLPSVVMTNIVYWNNEIEIEWEWRAFHEDCTVGYVEKKIQNE